MKSITKVCLALLASLTLTAVTASAQSDSTAAASTNAPAPVKPKARALHYMGKIASVDATAETLTITTTKGETKVLHIDSKTKIKKDGEAATLADATAGLRVMVSYHSNAAGDLVATTVNMGQHKKADASAAAPAAPTAPADSK